MLRGHDLTLRTGIAAAAIVSVGAWIGCNELFDIAAPVLESVDGGADAGDAAPMENCLNGIDDNGNGLVDCADPECQVGYGCAVDPVTGWNGLVYVQEITYSPNGAPPSPCPDGKLPAVYYAAPSAAECTSCSCALNGAACSAPKVDKFHLPGCNTYETSIKATTAACQTVSVERIGGPNAFPKASGILPRYAS
jgi:hypothetical protein